MHGAFGRGDRQRLLDMANRCLDKGKLRLVLDCSDLDSLGGSGASVLADLQSKLGNRQGEAVFVSVGPVIRRFLDQKFNDLPLRCFETLEQARAAFGGEVEAAAPASAVEESEPEAEPQPAVDPGLDVLLDDYEVDASELSESERRTADLVTAAYVSLDDLLMAAGDGGNPTVFGEAFAMLLDAHDLAAEAVACVRQGDHFVATDDSCQVPVEGGVVATLQRIRRPLTMLDVDDGGLWDEESQMLEDLQPDLIMPLFQGEEMVGVAFLHRGGEDREFSLNEVFALEMLQRLLAGSGATEMVSDEAPQRMVTLPEESSREVLLGVKLDLARGLQDAQDLPHFWQVFISRLRLASEVTSLAFTELADAEAAPFLAGEARRDDDNLDLNGERLGTFFRTLERPVEIANMPASFAATRDALLARGLQWLVSLRVEDQNLGVVALGLNWRCRSGEPSDTIHELMEITSEALLRLREGQRRANMSLGLLESLLVGEDRAKPDLVTLETARAVRLLARELGLPPDQERDLVLGALVRNFGQDDTAIDDLTSDRLTGEEWELFRGHPDAGDHRMADLDAPAAVRNAVRHHHERFDGRGFPLGLSGRDIPLMARLVAVAQHYALTLCREDAEGALAAVQQDAGKGLDPDLVQIFSKALRRGPSQAEVKPEAGRELCPA